jgi:hypothetical protein
MRLLARRSSCSTRSSLCCTLRGPEHSHCLGYCALSGQAEPLPRCRLIVQQITFGPPTIYARPSPTLPLPSGSAIASLPPTPGDRRISEAGAPQFLSPFRRNSSTFSRVLIPETPLRQRRMSSSFSRISYGIADDAGDEEVKEAMERGTGDGIVGAMFGKTVGQQIGSTWFW